MAIKVGDAVTYTGDPEQGTVAEIWQGKRARVTWASGLDAWVPLRSLSLVTHPASPTPAPARRCEECGRPIPAGTHADDITDGRMPGYCPNC